MKAFAANRDGVWVKNGSRGLAGRQGPSEGVSSCGDCATAPIDGIWREKIRGCSCTEANVYRPPSQYRIARTPSQIMMPQTTITNPKGS